MAQQTDTARRVTESLAIKLDHVRAYIEAGCTESALELLPAIEATVAAALAYETPAPPTKTVECISFTGEGTRAVHAAADAENKFNDGMAGLDFAVADLRLFVTTTACSSGLGNAIVYTHTITVFY